MDRKQAFDILEIICGAYVNFDITEKRAEIWCEMLGNMPYKPVLDNVKRHIRENKFPPTIAEIAANELGENEFLRMQEKWIKQSRWAEDRQRKKTIN